MAKQLLRSISIDPIFDSVKVIKNCQHSNFHLAPQRRTNGSYQTMVTRGNLFSIKPVRTTWRVSQFARGLLFGAQAHTREDPIDGFIGRSDLFLLSLQLGCASKSQGPSIQRVSQRSEGFGNSCNCCAASCHLDKIRFNSFRSHRG